MCIKKPYETLTVEKTLLCILKGRVAGVEVIGFILRLLSSGDNLFSLLLNQFIPTNDGMIIGSFLNAVKSFFYFFSQTS
jgi:hypothetical protein